MTQIRTSVQVEAPSEGGGLRRINWILRQLTEAPDSLAVEVLFARREQTSCEQLKDVRSNPAVLPKTTSLRLPSRVGRRNPPMPPAAPTRPVMTPIS